MENIMNKDNFPYKGFTSMARLWVNLDVDLKQEAVDKFTDWVRMQPKDTRFEMLTDKKGMHVYTH